MAGIPEEELEYDYHPTWATILLIPFLLNYFLSWYTWYRIDKRKQITWLACVFNVYPQLRAANVIRELWRDPKRKESLNESSVRQKCSWRLSSPPSHELHAGKTL